MAGQFGTVVSNLGMLESLEELYKQQCKVPRGAEVLVLGWGQAVAAFKALQVILTCSTG